MKRIGDYRKLRKHFIPRRTILFVKGKLNTSASEEKVLNARNIWVACGGAARIRKVRRYLPSTD